MFSLLLVFGFFVLVLSRPQEPVAGTDGSLARAPAPSPVVGSGSTPIPIISQTEEINPDGSFKFSFESGNGIKIEENGYQKDGSTEKIQVIQGSVSYTDNEGNVIHLKYIADENGFQPEGDHIPTSPPLPEAIAKSIKENAALSSAPESPQPSQLQLSAQTEATL